MAEMADLSLYAIILIQAVTILSESRPVCWLSLRRSNLFIYLVVVFIKIGVCYVAR